MFFLLDQQLRLIDEKSKGKDPALKITQGVQSCVDCFAPEKARTFKQRTWITCKIKNQVRRKDKLF